MPVTLKDLEIRYENIRKANPKVKLCSSKGCKNPVDTTELGEDTSCSYHRLLFDHWLYETMNPEKFHHYYTNQRARRSAFTRWQHKIGKEECDKIVLRLAQEPINWDC